MGDSGLQTVCLVSTSQGITPLQENNGSVFMKKWKKYIPQGFESFGYSNDTSANIYLSMLVSPAWLALTKNAQILYVYCKSQYYAERRKPIPQIRQLNDTQLKRCFTMNKSKWLDIYHIYMIHIILNKLTESNYIVLFHL